MNNGTEFNPDIPISQTPSSDTSSILRSSTPVLTDNGRDAVVKPSPIEDNESKSRKSEVPPFVLWVGAFASVVAALLGGLATWQVGTIAADTVHRSEKIEAYSMLAGASESYLSAYRELPACDSLTGNELGPSLADSHQSRVDISAAAARAYLVGSAASAEAALETDRRMSTLHQTVDAFYPEGGGEVTCRKFTKEATRDLEDAEGAVTDFLSTARTEMDKM